MQLGRHGHEFRFRLVVGDGEQLGDGLGRIGPDFPLPALRTGRAEPGPAGGAIEGS